MGPGLSQELENYIFAYQICMVIKFWKSACAAAALQAASVPFAMAGFLGALPGRHATVGAIEFKSVSRVS